MTLDRLREIANRTMRDLKQDLSRNGNVAPYFQAHFQEGPPKQFPMPPGTEDLMNNGRAKEILFDLFRDVTPRAKVTAWVFGTDMWCGKETEEGMKHRHEIDANTDAGFKKLEDLGWMKVYEAVMVTAQTETDVLMLRQYYVRHQEQRRVDWVGPPEEILIKQEAFRGRQKMWGATFEDVTGFDPTRKHGGAN